MTRDEPSRSWPWKGWFGIQIGCSCWMLIEGLLIMADDPPAGWVCLVGFMVLNAFGLFVWRRRQEWSGYTAIQAYLAVLSIVVAAVVLVVKTRGADEALAGLVSTQIPYWTLAVAPAVMAWMFTVRLRTKRRGDRA